MICHDQEIIFIHIPRAYGRSVESYLGGNSIHEHAHATALEYREEVGDEVFESYFTFALLRDERERMISLHRYLVAGGELCSLVEMLREDWRAAPAGDWYQDEDGETIVDELVCLKEFGIEDWVESTFNRGKGFPHIGGRDGNAGVEWDDAAEDAFCKRRGL